MPSTWMSSEERANATSAAQALFGPFTQPNGSRLLATTHMLKYWAAAP